MSMSDRIYRDSSGIGGYQRPMVRRLASQNNGVVTPTGTGEMFAQARHSAMAASCSCHDAYSPEHTPETFASFAEIGVHSNRPASRFGSLSPQQSISHRTSHPASRVWSYQQSSSPSPRITPRVTHEMHRNLSPNTPLEVLSPALTRTQRSYINASPPSAREALTMRFIKANMSHSPRTDASSQVSRAYSQNCEGFALTRNASAPVTTLTRTSSIQPQYAPRPPVNVSRRPTMQAMVQRQISEPVTVNDQEVSPVQREIEALNRAMQEFHENLSISPRVLQNVPETQPLVTRRTEPVSEMHTMHEPCPSPRGRSSHHEHMIHPERMHYYDHRPEQIQYVPPVQMYYNAPSEPEPSQESSATGLPDEIISQFPVTEFDEVAAEKWNEDLKTCSICLEQYTRGDRIRRLACTHGYHKVCIDEWLMRSTMCPICKFDYEIMMS